MPARTTDRRRRLFWQGGALTILFLFSAFASSCRSGDSMVFFADSYFESAFLTDDARAKLRASITDSGVRFDLRSLDPNTDAQSFIEMLGRSSSQFVVVTPFLADLAAAAAPVYRDRRFIVLYGDLISPQENIQRIAADRSSAFFDTGRFAARLSRHIGDTAAHGGRVVVVAYDGDERRQRELATFLDGFEHEAGSALDGLAEPEVRRFSSLQDGRAAARSVRDAIEEFDLIVVFLSSMNAEALQAIAGTEGPYVVTEGFAGPIPGSDRVVAVVEEDWIAAIALAVDSRSPRIAIPTALVPGPASSRLGVPTDLFESQ